MDNHNKMEHIDQLLTQILVSNNQKCHKYCPIPWSPTLHKLYLIHWYWKIYLSEACPKKKHTAALQQILSLFPASPKNGKTILANLHQVQHDLCEI